MGGGGGGGGGGGVAETAREANNATPNQPKRTKSASEHQSTPRAVPIAELGAAGGVEESF